MKEEVTRQPEQTTIWSNSKISAPAQMAASSTPILQM